MASFLDIGDKEIISVSDGRRLGYADDIIFDEATRRVQRLIIFGRNKFMGLGGKGEDIVIEWDKIKTVGTDIILVDTSGEVPAGPYAHHNLDM